MRDEARLLRRAAAELREAAAALECCEEERKRLEQDAMHDAEHIGQLEELLVKSEEERKRLEEALAAIAEFHIPETRNDYQAIARKALRKEPV